MFKKSEKVSNQGMALSRLAELRMAGFLSCSSQSPKMVTGFGDWFRGKEQDRRGKPHTES